MFDCEYPELLIRSVYLETKLHDTESRHTARREDTNRNTWGQSSGSSFTLDHVAVNPSLQDFALNCISIDHYWKNIHSIKGLWREYVEHYWTIQTFLIFSYCLSLEFVTMKGIKCVILFNENHSGRNVFQLHFECGWKQAFCLALPVMLDRHTLRLFRASSFIFCCMKMFWWPERRRHKGRKRERNK